MENSYLEKFDSAGPARKMQLVAFSDVNNVGYRGFFLEAAATLTITPFANDDTETITALFPAGYNPVMVKRFWATGSDAVNVYGLI